MAGAATLALREGEYIIDGIALDESYRGGGRGTALLNTVIDEVRKRGGSRIYLVARRRSFSGPADLRKWSARMRRNFSSVSDAVSTE